MKRGISTLVVTLAMLLVPSYPARASYYTTPLSSSSPFMVEVINDTTNSAGSATAVNVLYFGKTLDFDLFTFAANSPQVIISKLPRGTTRIVFQVNPPATGGAIVNIYQGSNTPKISQRCETDFNGGDGDHCEIVVDVIP